MVKVRQCLNNFFKPMFPPKNGRTNSTLLQWNLRLTCFPSFFGGNPRHQKYISKVTDLLKKNHKNSNKSCQKFVRSKTEFQAFCFLIDCVLLRREQNEISHLLTVWLSMPRNKLPWCRFASFPICSSLLPLRRTMSIKNLPKVLEFRLG
jgi:hypothetical protein